MKYFEDLVEDLGTQTIKSKCLTAHVTIRLCVQVDWIANARSAGVTVFLSGDIGHRDDE